jgi:predicted O-methyltransferase YrrM
MKRTLMLAGLGFAVGVVVAVLAFARLHTGLSWTLGPAQGPVSARTDAERRVLAVLKEMRESGRRYLSVDDKDGRLLRVLTEAIDAKNVVEVGTSTGYSGLWLLLALQRTGGRLTTFEINSVRAAQAREHFAKAGVANLVTVVEGDAHQTVRELREPIDLLFIDADWGGYTDYLNKLLPLVRPGGLIVAHNGESVPDYVKAVTSRPDLETVFVGPSLTLKKR